MPFLQEQLDCFKSGGADFACVPAASHHPAVLWMENRLLVSALVD
jgi:hypothetical protein